ncbi:MAG: hypothetical protein LBI66_09355 [Burkholderiaceae bacterium]|jgi:hypothetical protein|nr:hypothetical protein [Burkholderiaceae bacterium]
MFGISSLGWLHTLGSLPAIPAAAYMFARHGRIVPRSLAGWVYLVSMLMGAATVFLVARQPVSYAIGGLTLALVVLGYGLAWLAAPTRLKAYAETLSLTLSAFLLMLPTVTEVLRRVPDGHPLVTDLRSPLLLGVQGGLLLALAAGIVAQVLWLRRRR